MKLALRNILATIPQEEEVSRKLMLLTKPSKSLIIGTIAKKRSLQRRDRKGRLMGEQTTFENTLFKIEASGTWAQHHPTHY